MQNKKAILIPETIKIVIAVICIFLLIYLAVSLYGIFISKSEIEKARATLDSIIGKINSLDNDGDKLDYLITGPEAWNIYYFENVAKDSLITCGGENCLCSCPEFAHQEDIPTNSIDCINQGGICESVKNISFNSFCNILVEEDTWLPLKNLFEVNINNCFNIGNPPVKVYLEKYNGIIRFIPDSSDDSEINFDLSFLRYRQNSNSPTINELISDLINESRNPKNNIPGSTPTIEYTKISYNLTNSINSFVNQAKKNYWILRIKNKGSGETIITRGQALFEDIPTVIWSTTEDYTLKQENIEYQILFKTGVKS
ncbi:MAG: hypothetical protein GYA14_04855 [Ignavibacteria bacterium]|nr:hypothetical protein [Ignavibacteria bacterium]